MDELKPCPFCGGEAFLAIVKGQWIVCCSNGRCNVRTNRYMSQNRPVTVWNTRKDVKDETV